MASLLRVAGRRFQGIWRRRYATFAEEMQAEEEHALGTMATWRKISLFIAAPSITLVALHAVQKEKEHAQHVKEHGRTFIPYTHLRIRNKPFPWGDGNHSLIHNPKTNPLPEGYEDGE